MAVNTSLTAREDETYEQLLCSPDGALKLWHDKGETPGHKIEYRGETVWYRAPTRYQWKKDRSDAITQITAMAADLGTTVAPPHKAPPIPIRGRAPRGPEDREQLANLGRLFGEHLETAFDEEPVARNPKAELAPMAAPPTEG